MKNFSLPIVLGLLLAAGCAPLGSGARSAAYPDTVRRELLRPVPASNAYRAALERGTRDPQGRPGARYWQQEVRYDIRAELLPDSARLVGSERISYRNNSPDTLEYIVLNLYQNVFTETAPRNRVSPNTGGITLTRVAAQGETLEQRPVSEVIGRAPRTGYGVAHTLGYVRLPRPLAPGEDAALEVDWTFRVPPAGTYRTAWEDALGGRAFNVAQWYPQVATYDDVEGWDATPYLGDGEFYLEYGDFDVALTLPAGWVVGATGELQNPGEVLSPETRRRLALAMESDTAVRVVTEADLGAGRATAGRPGDRLTWRFRAEDVRDFAFAASDRYLWDAQRATVPADGGTRPVAVHALYRPGAPGWERATRYAEHATEFFSEALIPYLYPQITVAEGPIGGMEYPQLVFIARFRTPEALQSVIAHEVGHEWFPMMVGQNEAAFAWMDEGLTTYFEDRSRADFWPGSDPFAETRASYLRVAGEDVEVPLMRHTDLVSPYGARGVAAYSKPGTLLRSLRAVVGEETFDRAMRTYAREWLLKHPYPGDFFATLERESGQELDWFFYPWWFETGTLDQAVASVRPVKGGVEVVLRDLGELPAPTPLVATTAEGLTSELEIPASAWLDPAMRTLTLTLPTSGEVVRVEIDPQHLFPDVDRENNVWTAPAP